MAKDQVVEFIEKRDYDLLEELGDEEDVIIRLNEYDSSYICDAISEIANNAVPIYTSEVWETAQNVSDYVDGAMGEGLTSNASSIEQILQAGIYKYYDQLLYENLNAWAFNMIAEKVNEFLGTLDQSQIDSLDLDDIEGEIEIQADNVDSNDYVSNMVDKADEVIEYIKELLGIEE